jgi:hypothetical protein
MAKTQEAPFARETSTQGNKSQRTLIRVGFASLRGNGQEDQAEVLQGDLSPYLYTRR